MTALAWLVPVALFLGGVGLCAFLWSLTSGQYDDLEGAGWRALDDEQPLKAVHSDYPPKVETRRTTLTGAPSHD